MLLYLKEPTGLRREPLESGAPVPENTVWLDMLNLTPEEEFRVEQFLRMGIPTREEMHEIELSSSLYQEDGGVYMTFKLVTGSDTPEPETHAYTCILAGSRLITIRYTDPMPFRLFSAKVEKLPTSEHSGQALFVGLLESVIERIADILERVGGDIDFMTRAVFHTKGKSPSATPNYQEILERIGRCGDLASKARESLVTLSRMTGYALQAKSANIRGDHRARLETITRDVAALSDHVTFLSGKLNFLLDATLGMINIQQNNIIKIFSVAAVVFLPPTLIASIYGMNFNFIPELQWHYGYPFAVGMMGFSSLAPYLYFKRRKWL